MLPHAMLNGMKTVLCDTCRIKRKEKDKKRKQLKKLAKKKKAEEEKKKAEGEKDAKEEKKEEVEEKSEEEEEKKAENEKASEESVSIQPKGQNVIIFLGIINLLNLVLEFYIIIACTYLLQMTCS